MGASCSTSQESASFVFHCRASYLLRGYKSKRAHSFQQAGQPLVVVFGRRELPLPETLVPPASDIAHVRAPPRKSAQAWAQDFSILIGFRIATRSRLRNQKKTGSKIGSSIKEESQLH